ncbi:hypothetical protein RvY_07615-2 [Ramazzottius varieornatus]|uniref:Cyclic nucleotide-binding domain-containing protein n=1 Tax=Ramazzottius varieornatus TaxID=947166 RepID=A0A1D1V8W6_RAMVA|nr:hypothetical protein RvY_07615-2 [Ramazzottius varieornatus]
MGANLRPLMTALNIDRPQETLKVSKSMELFKIRDPMDEMVEYNMGTIRQQFSARFRWMKTIVYDFSVDPEGLFHYFWERCLIAMVVCTFFLNTYVGFFQSYDDLLGLNTRINSGLTNDEINAVATSGIMLIFFDYVMDIFFIVDYGLNFVTQIVTANGKITDHRTMALTYLKSWGCYTDLLAVFPIEIFAVAGLAGDGGAKRVFKLLGYLKVNRALRVLTLPNFFDHIGADLNNSITHVRIMKFTMYIAMFTQMCAVALFLTACDPSECYGTMETSWGVDYPPGMVKPDSRNTAENASYSYRYTSAMYYATELMTSVGYGDLYPHNVLEQMVVTLVVLVGAVMYGYVLASLTATVANLDVPRTEFQERLFALIRLMDANKLTKNIQNRAIDSVALLWSVNQGEEIPGVKKMTEDMPHHLMEDIQVDDLVHLVAGVPIFKNIEDNILRCLAPAVRRYLFPPDEYIVQQGDLIPELFVVRRGFCHMFHPDQSSVCVAVVGSGMYFGELGFLFNKNEILTVKTVTHCEVIALPRAAFDDVAANVEWLRHQIDAISQDRAYYDDLLLAAKEAKPYVKKGRRQSATRLSEDEKRKQRFRDDLKVANVSRVGALLCKLLRSQTIPMDSRFLMVWEMVRITIAVMQFMVIMIQNAFQIDELSLMITLWLVDIYAFVDIYIKFHVQYINDMNVTVTHPYRTAQRYLTSNCLIDLAGCAPFEFIIWGMAPNGDVVSPARAECLHWMTMIRMNRLLQIYRVPLAFHYLENNIKINTAKVHIFKYCLYFGLFITFVSCIPLIVQCPPLPCALSDAGCFAEINV